LKAATKAGPTGAGDPPLLVWDFAGFLTGDISSLLREGEVAGESIKHLEGLRCC